MLATISIVIFLVGIERDYYCSRIVDIGGAIGGHIFDIPFLNFIGKSRRELALGISITLVSGHCKYVNSDNRGLGIEIILLSN
jgi:hypothetical protein